MDTDVLIVVSFVYGGIFLILIACFVYAVMNRRYLIKLDAENKETANKVLADSEHFSSGDDDGVGGSDLEISSNDSGKSDVANSIDEEETKAMLSTDQKVKKTVKKVSTVKKDKSISQKIKKASTKVASLTNTKTKKMVIKESLSAVV